MSQYLLTIFRVLIVFTFSSCSPPTPKIPARSSDYAAEVNLTRQAGSGCAGSVMAYPSDWPNSHYYQRYCLTHRGLSVITDGIAPDSALHQTAYILDSMMSNMDNYIPDMMIASGFRQAVMGRYPYETVTSLPEYSHLDPDFWRDRRGCGATVASPVGANAEEDVLCYADDLYPDQDITVHEFGHSLHWLGFAQLWPQFQGICLQIEPHGGHITYNTHQTFTD